MVIWGHPIHQKLGENQGELLKEVADCLLMKMKKKHIALDFFFIISREGLILTQSILLFPQEKSC